MKLIAAVALLAGCVDSGKDERIAELEARIAKLEGRTVPTVTTPSVDDRDEVWFWCPLGGGICTAQYRKRPERFRNEESVAEWATKASAAAAALCDEHDPDRSGCVETRMVVCVGENKPGGNVCMLTRRACEEQIAAYKRAHPDRSYRCVAFFDGKPAKP